MEKTVETKEGAEIPPPLVVQPSKIFSIPLEPSDTHTSRQPSTENGYTKTKIEMPLDIIISLLRPDELKKLQKYIAFYLSKQ